MNLRIQDVRKAMPNYRNYADKTRIGDIRGIAIHHSAAVHPSTGFSMENALSIFRYHVEILEWEHGGYNYLVHPNGLIEYALDENIPAFHAGFRDPHDALGLEHGQFWNNHFLAICLLGWFDDNRTVEATDGQIHKIPNHFTRPTNIQTRSLLSLLTTLIEKYEIPVDSIRGHRELAGCHTACPGTNVDLAALRQALSA